MMNDATPHADLDLELRSGLAGLGGRPKRHPAWDERTSAASASAPTGSAKPALGTGARSESVTAPAEG